MRTLKRTLTISTILFFITLCSNTFAKDNWHSNRFQLEGNFATIFENDTGFNFAANYTPSLPGMLDGIVAFGGFWQWTFNADDIKNDTDVMKLGGDLRLQKAWGALVPYIKGELAWVRFDNGDSIDKLGIGPGAGLNFWLTHNIGFGAEVNTSFITNTSNSPKDQITSFLTGIRLGF